MSDPPTQYFLACVSAITPFPTMPASLDGLNNGFFTVYVVGGVSYSI